MATKTRQLADYLVEGGLSDEVQVKPHIQPGLLYPAMRKFKKIGSATGTAIGNMTANGGIASAFNGETYASYTASARKDPCADAFIGKDWGSGNSYKITRFKVWAPHNYSLAGTTASRYMKLQGSNDNSSWTDLYEDPDIIGNYQIIDVSAGITTTTAYRYHRLFFEGDSNGGAVAELEFYTEDNPGRVYLADKETAHSGAYGTEQSDGKKYYYTEIQGSKPIKDPRIGAHFGSQRHKTTSVQLLEEETATHGLNVYSIDGREWMRAYGSVVPFNNAHGTAIYIHDSTVVGLGHLEIVGYFSDINLQALAGAEPCDYRYKIDGGSLSAVQNTFVVSNNTPLGGRSVSRGSLAKVVSGQTLGIHTLTLLTDTGNDYLSLNSAELIAQDTSSTANRSKIQIPSQNVVSYGKKFTVSGTPHYDPFNGFTNGTTTFGTKVDTATSLGLGTGTTYGAPWAISSSNHIRPFNGGRVVKWVDSSGAIKTSVTMMPRNAQNLKTTASNEITTASATNSHTINFSDDAIDHSLSEVAKTFYIREFGNGADNGGTGSSSWADASMLSGNDDWAYVMDDGLTAGAGDDNSQGSGDTIGTVTNGDSNYYTWIGTGISLYTAPAMVAGGIRQNVAINLPYGTHVLKIAMVSGGTHPEYTLDGVALGQSVEMTYGMYTEITFHQPKKPPIPDDACIIADYMLCADWVAIGDAETGMISKGARRIHASRDIFYARDSGSNDPALALTTVNSNGSANFGFRLTSGSSSPLSCDLPVFSTNFAVYGEQTDAGGYAMSFGGSSSTITKLDNSVNDDLDAFVGPSSATSLGVNKMELTLPGGYHFQGFDAHGVIHTSSHYQPFETPFLYELVGGDRNMEQTNLVVTADGKTWDEVTRDTSYIGNVVVSATTGSDFNSDVPIIFDDWRGNNTANNATYDLFNKDFAIAYDHLICLRDGQYEITVQGIVNDNAAYSHIIRKNGTAGANILAQGYHEVTSWHYAQTEAPTFLKRGDYIIIEGEWWGDTDYSRFWIKRVN